MKIKAIFFDLDDTLHDHQKPFSDSFQQIFPSFPKEFSIESVCKTFRHTSDLLWENYIRKELTLEELRIQRIIQALKSYDFTISREAAQIFQLQYEKALTSIELFPEAPQILTKLSQMGFELGVITNGPTQHQSNKIQALGLTRYISSDRIFISDQIGIAKPDPNIFHEAAKKFSFSPENFLYIGDSWANDVVGANQAGWHAIWFNHRKRQPESHHKPLREIQVLSSMIEVLD
ncbi:HAD family hydrolase [Bacillus sp. 03113]|uniref:HAD family hydrolase n=1 Tax=Bacillus sp. 03113 TaxID=2578211 RepID=UPI00114167BD|nr:HAD family hydrolase [Bacillus sp. 03113]